MGIRPPDNLLDSLVLSFFKVGSRANQDLPVVDRTMNTTMSQCRAVQGSVAVHSSLRQVACQATAWAASIGGSNSKALRAS